METRTKDALVVGGVVLAVTYLMNLAGRYGFGSPDASGKAVNRTSDTRWVGVVPYSGEKLVLKDFAIYYSGKTITLDQLDALIFEFVKMGTNPDIEIYVKSVSDDLEQAVLSKMTDSGLLYTMTYV